MLCVKPTREYIQNLYEAGLYRSAELLGGVLPKNRINAVSSLFYLAAALQQLKRYSQAIEKLYDALLLLEHDKQNASITECDIRWLLYQCYHALHDYDNALLSLQQIKPKSRTVQVYMALGNLYRQIGGNKKDAIECYKEVVKTQPLALEAIENLMELGQSTKEIVSLTTETMFGKFDWLIDWIEGCSHKARNENVHAISRYNQIIDCNGHSSYLMVKIACCYDNMGKYCKAKEIFEAAYKKDNNFFESAGVYASVLHKLEDEATLEQFCVNMKDGRMVESYICHSYLSLLKEDYGRALLLSDKAIEIKPRYTPALTVRGMVLFRMNKLTEAIVTFRQVIALQPGCFEAHKGMVMSLLRYERHKEAVVAAKASVKRCPGQARAFMLVAYTTSRYPQEHCKLKEKAKDFYLRALSLDPTIEEAVCCLTNIYIREGNVHEGLEHVKNYLTSNSSARGHACAGHCYAALGQVDQAHYHYNIALGINPNLDSALNGLHSLDSLDTQSESHSESENEFSSGWVNL